MFPDRAAALDAPFALRSPAPALIVFACALAWFAVGVTQTGVAAMESDPVSGIAAQDEAVYLREAIEMVETADWLTPTYMGRLALNKPPLTQWLATASMSVFGVSAWAGRLPSMLAAAGVVTIVFLWSRALFGAAPALAAAILLGSSHLFYVFARMCVTDMLLTFWIAAALWLLARDPALHRNALWFGLCCGAAVMTKAAAGLLPFLALAVARPPVRRVAVAAAAAAAAAAPWHIYQAATHTRWFWAEYVLTQHLAIGVTAPPQYSHENHLWFYLRRMWLMDPPLTFIASAGIFLLRDRLGWAWLGSMTLALFAFRYRSAYYLLPLLPALALCAAAALRRVPRSAHAALFATLALTAAIKADSGSAVCGVPLARAAAVPSAAALESYCELDRGAGLISIGAGDHFYGSTLPLANLRYALPAPRRPANATPALDFDAFGIAVTTDQFLAAGDWRRTYQTKLAAFDAPPGGIGTVIWTSGPDDIARLIAARPETDFLIPRDLLLRLSVSSPHRPVEAGAYTLLLSPEGRAHRRSRPCRM